MWGRHVARKWKHRKFVDGQCNSSVVAGKTDNNISMTTAAMTTAAITKIIKKRPMH
jgi:hypothetical protein